MWIEQCNPSRSVIASRFLCFSARQTAVTSLSIEDIEVEGFNFLKSKFSEKIYTGKYNVVYFNWILLKTFLILLPGAKQSFKRQSRPKFIVSCTEFSNVPNSTKSMIFISLILPYIEQALRKYKIAAVFYVDLIFLTLGSFMTFRGCG